MVIYGEGLHLTKTVDLLGEAVWLCRWPASPLRVVVGCPRSVDLAGALFIEEWAKFWDPGSLWFVRLFSMVMAMFVGLKLDLCSTSPSSPLADSLHPKLLRQAFLSGPNIETPSLSKLSDAGEALACRRRDITFLAYLCFTMFFFFPLFLNNFHRSVTFFQISRTISNPSYLGGYASISDSGQRWCPANFLPHPLLVASWPERTAHALSNSPEDSLHRASLMAGDISLGPSVAPCPVKTSTAHDDPLAWETVFLTGKANPLLFSASALDHAHRLQTPYLPPPESLASSHFSPSSPYSRRLLNLNWLTEEKLGFSLVGSASKSGPLTSPKPKSVCYGPPPSFNKPRSVSEFYLSISSQLLCRFSNLNGQGLHLRCKSPSMLWIYEFFLRTLLLDSPIAMIYDSFCLKYYGRLFPIPIRHGVIIVTKALCPNTTFRQIYLPSSSTI
ncbi:unnamed protein product [Arabidopsis lyrata]|nr:unnamed protein product [Arabidopsis lyrata]